jgi:hypothetical protein
VVFGGGANHGRAADIDIFNRGWQVATRLGDSGGEWVKVDGDQINRANTVLGHDRIVDAATAENATVDFRVQGLHPAIHHFRKAGVVGHFHGCHAVVLQQFEGAAGGENFHAKLNQFTGKFKDAGLVGNADQRAADGKASGLVGHGGFHQAWLAIKG